MATINNTSPEPTLKNSLTHLSHFSHHTTHVKRKGKISAMQSHLVAASGEFVGTFFFLWMSYSASLMVLNQKSATALDGGGSSAETVVYIALIYGFSLLVNAWAFFRISGGLFNPAVSWTANLFHRVTGCPTDNQIHTQVSLGLSICGAVTWTRTAFLVPAQLAASMVAGGLVKAMFSGDISGANTTLAPGTSIVQGLFIEMFLTAQLIFVILMLAAEKSRGTFLAPIGIGLALFVSELSGK